MAQYFFNYSIENIRKVSERFGETFAHDDLVKAYDRALDYAKSRMTASDAEDLTDAWLLDRKNGDEIGPEFSCMADKLFVSAFGANYEGCDDNLEFSWMMEAALRDHLLEINRVPLVTM